MVGSYELLSVKKNKIKIKMVHISLYTREEKRGKNGGG
jgi:hypothetical protein